MQKWKEHQVGSIWGVGRNYADHAKEMNAPVPTRPLVFLKSGATLDVAKGGAIHKIRLPQLQSEIHHELEIALYLGTRLKVDAIGLALDLTARDIQADAKKKGEPWTLAKSFKSACPVGPRIPFPGWKAFERLEFKLQVNGELRQHGVVRDMIFRGPELLKYLKTSFPLRPGDMILTGTPQGVGPFRKGDSALAELSGPVPVAWRIKIS